MEELSPEALPPAELVARELLGQVQARIGGPMSLFEWRMLNVHGENSAAEFSPVEAEILVRLLRQLDGTTADLSGELPEQWLNTYLQVQHDALYVPPQQGPPQLLDAGSSEVLAWLGWVVAATLLFGLALDGGFWVAVPLLLLGGTNLALKREKHRLVRLVLDQLPGSNILERLIDNDPSLDDIRRYTPVPLNWLLLGLSSKGIEERIKLVSRHLDWYLAEPALYVRVNWLFRVLWVIAPFMLVDWVALLTGQGWQVGFGFHLVLLLLGTAWFARRERLEGFYGAALIKQLLGRVKERLAARAEPEI